MCEVNLLLGVGHHTAVVASWTYGDSSTELTIARVANVLTHHITAHTRPSG